MFKQIAGHASVEIAAASEPAPRACNARHLLLAATVLAAFAAAALAVDFPIARFAKEGHMPGELRRLVRLAEVFAYGGSVALIIAVAATLDRRGWRVVLCLAVPAFGAGALADVLKLLVARLRPAAANLDGHWLDTFVAWLPLAYRGELGRNYGYALQSFPSAHAATAAGLAAGLAALYPRGRWLFALFALGAVIQRIEAQAHFTSDVLAGAAVGCLVAAAFGKFLGSDKLTKAYAGPRRRSPRDAAGAEVR